MKVYQMNAPQEQKCEVTFTFSVAHVTGNKQIILTIRAMQPSAATLNISTELP